MKKLIIVIVVFISIAACTKKAVPTAAAPSAPAPVAAPAPTPDPVAPAITPPPTGGGKMNLQMVESGKKIYNNSCGRCHGLKKTENYTQEDWVGIMERMAKKARLTDTEKADVLAYAQYYAKDAEKNRAGM